MLEPNSSIDRRFPVMRRAALLACTAASLLAGCAAAPRAADAVSARMVSAARGPIEVLESGPRDGEPVLLIPSLGRGAEDFDDLAGRLARAGYRVIRPQPRGIGRSAAWQGEPTLVEIAEDAMAALTDIRPPRRVVVVGHAFGNRVARMIATREPARVRALVLLAAGGKVRMASDVERALVRSFDLTLPEEERMRSVALAFFAPGNDASVWRDGWFKSVAEVQIAATERTPVDSWWAASDVPVLVVQPMQDVLAPAENAEKLRKEGGDRVRVAYVDRAGHALLPEQPDAVASNILAYLRGLPK